MKIAFVHIAGAPNTPTGGLSDVVWEMVEGFCNFGDDVHIIAPYEKTVETKLPAHIHHLQPYKWERRNIIGHTILSLRALKIIRQLNNFDIVIAPEYLSTAVISLFSPVPTVLVTPGNIYERIVNGNPFDWFTTQYLKLAARLSARNCFLINAISEDMRKWWQFSGADSSKILVLPYGVQTSLFKPIMDARVKLGLSAHKKIILYVGRLSPEKNVDLLLTALSLISHRLDQFDVRIIGDGPAKESLQRSTRTLGLDRIVHFEGSVTRGELAKWYSSADVCVMPSISEPLGRVMLEALACGALFIGADVGGIKDHIHHGRNGFLFSPSNAEDLAEILSKIAGDEYAVGIIKKSARHYVETNLEWHLIISRFRNTLLDMLNNE